MSHRKHVPPAGIALACVLTGCGPGTTEGTASGSSTTAATGTGTVPTSGVLTGVDTSSANGSTAGNGSSSETTWGSMECPNIFEGDLVLTDETDVDALRTVFRVTGDVLVEETAFVDLEFLSCLQRIDGSLLVRRNPLLENLNGLEQLESFINAGPFGGVSIEFNPKLQTLAALGAVREMRRLQIWDNDSLTDLGLNSLETVVRIAIGECVRGDEKEPYSFSNDALVTIDGFASLREARVEVGGQANLVSLGSLHDVEARGGELSGTFWHNPQLATEEIESLGLVGCGNEGFEQEECLCPNPG